MSQKSGVVVVFLSALFLLLAAGSLAAEPQKFHASQIDELATAFGELNGDRDVYITLGEFRGLTPYSGLTGLVRINLIEGKGFVELGNVEQPVDLYAVDNMPAEGSSFLPEPQDRAILLARVEKDGRVDFEADTRGFELDRIFVVAAGSDLLDTDFILMGTRPSHERLFTQKRLRAEGFDLPVRVRRPQFETDAVPELKSGGFGLATQASSILVFKGLVTQTIFDGGISFFHEDFNGNGRTCGTCHPPENNQVVGPAFIQDLAASGQCDLFDPTPTGVCAIFIAEQRFNVYGSADPISDLEKPALMRANGLIMENVDGILPNKNPSEDNHFMMRSVPHSLSVGTSFMVPVVPDGGDPNFAERTGWSGDGAPNAGAGLDPNGTGSFRDFVTGAIMQHYPAVNLTINQGRGPGADFRLADEDELDDVNAFLKNTGRITDPNAGDKTTGAAVDFSFKHPLADGGRAGFVTGTCNNCHGDAGANSAFFQGNILLDTGVERLPNPNRDLINPRNNQPFDFDFDCGNSGQAAAAADIEDLDVDGDGVNDCFGNGRFNVTPIIEAADTGPWFHNNLGVKAGTDFSQPTPKSQVTTGRNQQIEDAIRFYNTFEFNNSPGSAATGITFAIPEAGINAIGAFLRSVNAAFDIQQCLKRNHAARVLSPTFLVPSSVYRTANKLASLCNDEIDDVFDVLTTSPAGSLDPGGVLYHLNDARIYHKLFIASTGIHSRRFYIKSAFNSLKYARSALGTGLDKIKIGQGTLMF